MAADFSSLLSKKVDEQKRPPLLPAGTYEGLIKDYTVGEASNENKTPYVRFNGIITASTEDIDQEDLVDAEGKPIDVNGRRFPRGTEFWLTEDSLFRLSEFLQSGGIETDGRSFAETLPETKNMPVLITLNQVTSRTNSEEMFNNVVKIVGNNQ